MPSNALEPEVLDLLRCPVTGSRLRQEGDVLIAVDDPALRYPVDQGVPRLLADARL